jgi:hypothetical protein
MIKDYATAKSCGIFEPSTATTLGIGDQFGLQLLPEPLLPCASQQRPASVVLLAVAITGWLTRLATSSYAAFFASPYVVYHTGLWKKNFFLTATDSAHAALPFPDILLQNNAYLFACTVKFIDLVS